MSFDVAAADYDEYMGRWSQRLSDGLVDAGGVGPGMHVLDVGCGTGALTAALVRRAGAGNVSAVDPSPSFVRTVRDRFPHVDVREAPAERLPFDDATFDASLAQLVVHFMTDPVAGLTEMRRVTRPGGVVAACVWDFAGGRGPLGVFWDAARETWPDVRDESGLAGTRNGHLVELFRAAGLRRVSESVLHATIEYPSFEAWWAPFTTGVGPGGAFVKNLEPSDVDRLRDACERRLDSLPITVHAAAWAARGSA